MIQPIQTDSTAKITRIVAVLVATVIIVGVMYGIYSLFGNGDTSDDSDQQRVITVEVGDVVDSISIQGATTFPHNSLMSFGINGTISKIHVQQGDLVKTGDILIELDEYSLMKATLSIQAAQYEVQKTQQQLDYLQNLTTSMSTSNGVKIGSVLTPSWDTAYKMASAMVKKNELTTLLTNAQFELNSLLSPSVLTIASAELEYLSLQLSLKAVQQHYDEMLATVSFPDINELDHTRAQLAVLRHQRDTALADWERMVSINKSQYTQKELEEMFASTFTTVKVVKHSLDEVTAQISALTSSPDQELIALKQAELAIAEEALTTTHARVVRISALHDGVVRKIYATQNTRIEAYEIMIDLADYSEVQVTGHLHELDALSIMPGTKAVVNINALPDTQFTSQILEISTAPTNRENTVSYATMATLDAILGEASLQIRAPYILEGLSATIDIVITESNDVIRIPIHTVGGSLSLPTVTLYDNEAEIANHPIIVGNHDDYWIEVLEGLSEGDQIIGVNLQ
jgi:multidrug efflux pump subunit AcrA (membrane-fusion protein)